ncbi:MAG: SRPBCC family protein [Actinomycetota bacterium]
MGRKGSVEAYLEGPPGAVFAAITDPAGLPEWNRRIARTLEHPTLLGEGAEWVVEMRVYGQRFPSRSRVLTLDPEAGRFQYRSSPDGDPDFSIWTWEVSPAGNGSKVRVSWDLNPKLFTNRMFWVRLRFQGLQKEVPESLAALERLIRANGLDAMTSGRAGSLTRS